MKYIEDDTRKTAYGRITFQSTRHNSDIQHYRAGDKIKVTHSYYTFGSCASSAIERGDCPMYSMTRAETLGHKMHWLNQDAGVISNPPHPAKKFKTQLHPADLGSTRAYFEGHVFIIDRAPNNNLQLIDVTDATIEAEIANMQDYEHSAEALGINLE